MVHNNVSRPQDGQGTQTHLEANVTRKETYNQRHKRCKECQKSIVGSAVVIVNEPTPKVNTCEPRQIN